jgi:Protein of unknown function (DUF1360)
VKAGSETQAPADLYRSYAEPSERPPFAGYALLALVFNAAFAGAVALARRSGRELPERVENRDVLLFGVAGHKLSRLITKDKVTSFIRAPFTEYEAKGGPAEVEERSRGTGLRKAIGDLLVCPYCIGLWVVGAFHAGALLAPRATRLIAATFTTLTVSDFLQIAYKAAENKGLGEG